MSIKLPRVLTCAIALLGCTTFLKAATTADIVVLIDESGSMSGEQAWISGMITSLDTALIAASVSANRFALVGFGGPAHGASGSNDPHKHLFSTSDWSTSAGFGGPDIALATSGGTEDGLQAINFALGAYSFRPEAAINFILIGDENRVSGGINDRTAGAVTAATLLPLLKSSGILLNNVNQYTYNGGSAFGHDSDGNAYFVNGSTFTKGLATTATGNGIVDYHGLALDSGGASWDLSYLRNATTADAFTSAFVSIKVQEIVDQNPTVPDTGATILLLGLSLTGLGFARRKLGA